MKLAIIGYSGSGKSSLARSLSQHYSLPLLHLDQLRFAPNWQENSAEEMTRKLQDFLNRESSWVIDGNYSTCFFEERMEQADHIILMDFSRWTCLYRAFKRYLHYRGRVREDMAEGCLEKFDWEFIRWILWEGRSKSIQACYRRLIQTYTDKIRLLKNQKDLDTFLKMM